MISWSTILVFLLSAKCGHNRKNPYDYFKDLKHFNDLKPDDDDHHATTAYSLLPLEEIENVAVFGDAEARGPQWYASSESSDGSRLEREKSSPESSLTSSSSDADTSETSDVSSHETSEEKAAFHRVCTPCPTDMLKKWKNMGIKWICGGYQRARRSFKSICMMRYRNCQDGTMFVKHYSGRCRNNSFHGRHWFYVYKV